jgi:acyl-coenzyme A thioesterase 13
VSEKLWNICGTMHGGMVATVADMPLGYALAWSSEPPTPMVTASLTIDYAGTAQSGDWIESRVDIQKKGAKLAFAKDPLIYHQRRTASRTRERRVLSSLTKRARGLFFSGFQ